MCSLLGPLEQSWLSIRVARALRDIMQRFLLMPVVNYFDDYPRWKRPSEPWGGGIAEEPKKRTPPSASFVVLGVVIDLTQSHENVVKKTRQKGWVSWSRQLQT